MGQYFKFINKDKKEFFTPNGGAKTLEVVSDPIGTGMLAYLLLQGPQDGTRFSGLHNHLAPEWEDEMAEKMEEERERHKNEGRSSMYRNDDGSWDKRKLVQVIAAGHQISEDFRFAGRWAGDDIAVVGDYDDSGLYGETSQDWVYEYEGEEFTQYATSRGPIVPESIERDDISHSTMQRDVEPGDLCKVSHPESGDDVYAEFVRPAQNEWTDITDRLKECFAEFVGEGWVDDHDDSWLMRPDMIIGGDEDGNPTVFTGSITAAMTNDEIGGGDGDTSDRNGSDSTQGEIGMFESDD